MARILIVDDDQYIRELYEEVLKDAGYEVETAVDGEEGLAKITQNNYNLIVLDIMMPKLDGLGVLTKIKEGNLPHGKIVLLTNLAHDPLLEEAQKNGAAGYLIKADLDPEQLVNKLKLYLQ